MLVEKTNGEEWSEVISPEFGCVTPSPTSNEPSVAPTSNEPSVAPSTGCKRSEFQLNIVFHADDKSHAENAYYLFLLNSKGKRKEIFTMPNSEDGRIRKGKHSEKSICLKKKKCYEFVVT